MCETKIDQQPEVEETSSLTLIKISSARESTHNPHIKSMCTRPGAIFKILIRVPGDGTNWIARMAKQPNTAEELEGFLREDKYTEFRIQCSGKRYCFF